MRPRIGVGLRRRCPLGGATATGLRHHRNQGLDRHTDRAASRRRPGRPDRRHRALDPTRPDPLPDSTTMAGDFPAHSAHIFAGALAREITMRSGGHGEATVKTVPGQRRLVVEHPVEVYDTDAAAVARYTRITQLRANTAALDPVADA